MDGCVGREQVDPHAWRGLEELRGALRAFLVRHCADPSELEDVIQETYLRAARYRSGRRRVRRLKPWTMRIALNVLSDWKRRGSRFIPLPLEDAVFEIPTGDDGFEYETPYRVGQCVFDQESALSLLANTLHSLREGDRSVLDSFYCRERRSGRTAEECGVPRHLVKIRLFRARERLVRALRRRVALEENWRALAS